MGLLIFILCLVVVLFVLGVIVTMWGAVLMMRDVERFERREEQK